MYPLKSAVEFDPLWLQLDRGHSSAVSRGESGGMTMDNDVSGGREIEKGS